MFDYFPLFLPCAFFYVRSEFYVSSTVLLGNFYAVTHLLDIGDLSKP